MGEFISYLKTPIGILKIFASVDNLIKIDFVNQEDNDTNPNFITLMTVSQIEEYFSHKRKSFDLPIKLEGTPFQQQCYQVLLSIPFGQTITYQDQAKLINNPKACRAVGNANGKNNLPIIIPCHRVVSLNNKLGGYTGGVEKKIFLLNHEKGLIKD